jgi:hypothetical protein
MTGQTAPSSPVSALNLSVIQSAMSQLDFAGTGLTISDFFTHEMIVLVGVGSEFEAMTVAYYDTSVAAAAQFSGDVLLPAFLADPNAFAAAYPYSDLYNIHPFATYIGKNTSGIDFGVLDNEICTFMTGAGARAPASVDDDGEALKTKLKEVPYLVAGKNMASAIRGEPRLSAIDRIWHSIVEALSILP